MEEKSKLKWPFYISLICAIWFALTSFAWTYLANVFISFPFGFVSLILLQYSKRQQQNVKAHQIVAWILIAGVILALGSLLFFLVTNS